MLVDSFPISNKGYIFSSICFISAPLHGAKYPNTSTNLRHKHIRACQDTHNALALGRLSILHGSPCVFFGTPRHTWRFAPICLESTEASFNHTVLLNHSNPRKPLKKTNNYILFSLGTRYYCLTRSDSLHLHQQMEKLL